MTNAVSRNKKSGQKFIVSESNRLAYTMAMNVLDHPGPGTSPLLICGAIGTGKTHLLKSLEHYLQVFHPDKRAKYITAERYKIDLIRSLTQNRKGTLTDEYKDPDVLLLDDVQGFIGHEYVREDFIKVAKQFLDAGKVLIFTADRVPSDLEELTPALFSIVTSNQIVALETADSMLKRQVALQKAFCTAHKNLREKSLNEIIEYLAGKEDYDLRKLTGSIQRVILLSELTGEEISIDFAKKVGA